MNKNKEKPVKYMNNFCHRNPQRYVSRITINGLIEFMSNSAHFHLLTPHPFMFFFLKCRPPPLHLAAKE